VIHSFKGPGKNYSPGGRQLTNNLNPSLQTASIAAAQAAAVAASNAQQAALYAAAAAAWEAQQQAKAHRRRWLR
jgi:hypothetical protein